VSDLIDSKLIALAVPLSSKLWVSDREALTDNRNTDAPGAVRTFAVSPCAVPDLSLPPVLVVRATDPGDLHAATHRDDLRGQGQVCIRIPLIKEIGTLSSKTHL
jgi:hypothetical protein